MTGVARPATVADAGRVIAGTARGIRLAAPGEGTRPIGDRVKQTLFAILEPGPARGARSSTCSPAAARPASRPSRAAPRRRSSSSGTRGPARSSTPTSSAPISRARPRGSSGPRPSPGSAGSRRRRGRPLRSRHRRPALRGHGRPPPQPRAGGSARSSPGGARRREALLAGPAAGAGRPASIRAGAPVRRDRAHVLSSPGGHDDDRGLPRLVRPDHQRPPRHRATRDWPCSIAWSSASWPTRASRRCCRSTTGSPSSTRPSPADGIAAERVRGRRLRRPDRRLLPVARRQRHRPRPARDQRLRDRDAARPQQPGPRAGRRHGLLHDRRSRTATSAPAWSRRSPRSAATSRA